MDKTIQKTGADVNGMVVYNKKILILYRPEYGLWEVPHGKIELEEHPEITAKREIQEETGLIVTDMELVSVDNWIYEKQDSIKNMVSLTYIASVNTDKINTGPEHTEYKWVTLSELNQIPNISSAIRKLLHKINTHKTFNNQTFPLLGKIMSEKMFLYIPEKNIVLTAQTDQLNEGLKKNKFSIEFSNESIDLPHWLKDIIDNKSDPIDKIIEGKTRFLGEK